MAALSTKNMRIGLVLSGGGIRGMAHLGLIRALEEYDLNISVVSGTSVGAVVGALYCNGRSVEEMLDFFRATPLFKYNYMTWNKPGLVDTDRYFKIFKEGIGTDRFEELQIPLYVMATNLEKGKTEVFHQGDLIPPIMASAALPPYFSPVRIKDQLYADGGVMNNFPTEPLENKVDYIIGSNVIIVRDVSSREIRSSLQLTQRTTSLMMYALNKPKLSACDLLFEPKELEGIRVLDKKQLETAYQIGYAHAIKVLSTWEIPV